MNSFGAPDFEEIQISAIKKRSPDPRSGGRYDHHDSKNKDEEDDDVDFDDREIIQSPFIEAFENF